LARDTELNRPVAVKALPPELLADSTVQSRFRREARTLAALNHANIASIHDMLEHDDGRCYLILEYVPGQTLAELLAQGYIEMQDVLTIGRSIAEGLATAYERGIIHRDLKPSNVKITPDGIVKVLDFGIAKALKPDSETKDSVVTQPGHIIGTPAYMSPEQTRGKTVDHRSDIWSFGCVMYEMFVGHLAFEGETVSDTIAHVLQTEPDWEKLPADVPGNIRVLLRRCLEKDSRQRLQHIGDAVIEINETLNVPVNAPPLSVSIVGESRSASWRSRIIYCVVGLIIVAIVVGIALRNSNPRSSPEQVLPSGQRTLIKLPDNQTLGLSRSTPLGFAQPAIALSPDGSSLVYVADNGKTTQLFVRLMNEFQARPIPGTENAFCPFFSPDGRWVGFFTKDKLKKVSLLGGEPEPLCDARNPRGASWGDDDTICFADYQGETLTQISAAGGTTALVVAGIERSTAGSYYEPEILPGGKWVLFSSRDGDIAVVSPKTGEKRILIKNGYLARYLPIGHLVYARGGVLMAVPFDLAALKVAGDSVPVLEKVLLDSTHRTVQYTFSGNGLLVYVPGDDMARSIPVFVDRQNKTEPLPMPAQIYGTPKLSPDGKQLAIVVGPEGKQDIYVYDVATGRSMRLTLEGSNKSPVWTPGGERIIFARRTKGQEEQVMFWKSVDGSDESELLHSSEYYLFPGSWSPNSKVLSYYEICPATGSDILALTVESTREPELIVGTEATEWGPAFSPDGRWIAYTSDRDGNSQVYILPYPDNDWVRPISDDFGEEPVWSPKGDKLFYRNGDKWMAVSISTESEFTMGTPKVLFEGPYKNVPGISYDVAPDGRFLVLQPEIDDSEVRELHVVTNWFDELKRLVPADGK
jgi:serine/threonine-protein kinase